MSRVEPQKFLVGDREWTGHANGGSIEHEGVIKRIYLAGEPGQLFDQARSKCPRSTNARASQTP